MMSWNALLVAQADVETRSMDARRGSVCPGGNGRIPLGSNLLSVGFPFPTATMASVEIFAEWWAAWHAPAIDHRGNFVHPENVFGSVLVTVFGVGAFFLHQRGVFFLKASEM